IKVDDSWPKLTRFQALGLSQGVQPVPLLVGGIDNHQPLPLAGPPRLDHASQQFRACLIKMQPTFVAYRGQRALVHTLTEVLAGPGLPFRMRSLHDAELDSSLGLLRSPVDDGPEATGTDWRKLSVDANLHQCRLAAGDGFEQACVALVVDHAGFIYEQDVL